MAYLTIMEPTKTGYKTLEFETREEWLTYFKDNPVDGFNEDGYLSMDGLRFFYHEESSKAKQSLFRELVHKKLDDLNHTPIFGAWWWPIFFVCIIALLYGLYGA